MRTTIRKDRPKYLDLFRIKLPITGIVSIGHRASGILLVLTIPIWLYLLETSVTSEQDYQDILKMTDGFVFSLMAFLVFWSLVHHLFAGVRFLLLDLDIGIEKYSALRAAKLVFVAEAIVMVFVAGWLL